MEHNINTFHESSSKKTIGASEHILSLVDSIESYKDIEGLKVMHKLLGELILAEITDNKSSFIDIQEYCESIIIDIEQNRTPEESVRLRELIDKDIK